VATLAELYAAHPLWSWLALAAILLAIEIGTGTGWLLWPSACAAVTAFVTKVPGVSFPGAVVAFAVLTAASTLLSRRYMPRTAPDGPDINDGAARLVGRRGRAVQAFAAGSGRVLVDGKEWPAELEAPGSLAAGDGVEVLAVRDGLLRIRPAALS
jgi:membrane protein implicated in regulation of membrane protease activity